MKTNTVRAKLLNCFFAFTLVFGLCIPSIGSYAYAEPTNEAATDMVSAYVEGTTPQGENQPSGGGTNNLGDGNQDEIDANDADNTANNGETGNSDTTETEQTDVATAQADEIMPMAADVTVGGLTISGGTQNTDFTVSGAGTSASPATVVVKTSTPLTLKGSVVGSVQIQQGASANITLNDVTITANSNSSPINLMGAGTTLRLSLVDGTTNNLAVNSPSSTSCAGIHCGAGSTLYVDDAVANWSNTGTHIEVLNGVVNTTATLENGTSVTQGDPVTRLASPNPGILIVKGGAASAGIGSGASENSGNMHFDGGVITAYSAGGHINNGGTNANQNWSSGTGIGAGAHGGATNMWFDGATVDAYGSYHGAGVGAGWTTAAGSAQTGTTGGTPNNTCGNIYINAGYLKSQGYEHGNAFGGACGTTATNCIIRITGGTLHPSSYSGKFDIGGSGGYTIVTGGSVYVENKNKFTGVGDTAYNTQGVTTWSDVTALGGSLPNTDKVFMLTVDLSTSSEKLTNEKLENFKLFIGGEDANYGAPTQFEDGKLYLWLPEWVAQPNAEKEVRIEMTVRQDDGTTKQIDPLFIAKPSSSDTTQTVKRYIEFDFPEDYAKTLEKDYDGLPFPALTVDDEHPIKIKRDVNGSIIEETLDSPNDVRFKYQMLTQNEAGDWVPTGSESEEGAATLPADTGKFQVTMTSYQYANDPNYASSYWGHQAKGVATINPVPAVLTMEGVEWGHLADNGTWTQITEDSTESGVAGNRLKLQFNIRSANTTALTCAAPTGSFQVSIDGEKVGQPILIPVKPDGSSSSAFDDSSYSTVSWLDLPVESETGVMQSRHGIKATYYFDPTNNDALLKALEDASRGGKHTVNVEYIADKNYIQGVDKNPENAKDDETFIIPVSPETDVKTDTGTDIPDVPTSPEDPDNPNNPLNPSDNNISFIHKSVTLKYSDYMDKTLGLTFKSTSSMPMICTTSNNAVAELVKDENGNVLGADGKVNLQVNSCGTTRIIMEQSANALYTGTKIILDVTVIPDESIKPQVQIRLVTNNLTHPGMPAAPGDDIEYLVTGLNTTPGSSWQAAHLLDTMDSRLTLKEDSVKLASNYSTPNMIENEAHDYTLGTEAFYNGFDWSSLSYTDLAKGQYDFDKNANKVSKGIGSVYGGQSTTLRFVATLQSGTADRPQNPGDPAGINNEPEGTGGYGKEETDLKPGEDMPDTTPLIPGKDIVVVGEPNTPDDPSDTPGDDESNPIPPLPIIPKDPVLPGTDPVDPNDPDNPGDDPTDPNNPGKVDPDISVNKTAKNLTHPTGNKALVGDEIEYSITVENKGKDTCYYWPIIKDTLPTGLTPVAGSFELTKVDGSKVSVPDSAYQASTHTISLYVDDLYGNEKTTLTFKCTVTPEATDIANTAQVIGTTPSDKWKGEHPDPIVEPDDDPETSYIKFDANGGSGAPKAISGETSSVINTPFPTTEPTREGYEFVGWNTQANGTGLGITSYPSHFLSKPGSIYYYAQWKKLTSDTPGIEPGDPAPVDPTQFSYILFAANGGTGAPEGIKGEPASAIADTFPTVEPTAPDGYKFVGWFTEKDAGDKVEEYPDNFPVVADADNNAKPTTVTYYAHWQKIDDPTDTTPPAGGDPDPVDPLGLAYIKFDANGGKFVVPVVAQAEGDDATPVWSTAGLTGTPNGSISDIQKNTFPSKKYGPVVRSGYTFTGWYDHPTEGKEVTAYDDSFADTPGTTYYYAHWVKDPEPTWPPTPGQPFSPDPKIPASEYPWDDPDNPFDWDEYLKDTPQIDTPEPADVGKVMPADPDLKDLRITLSAKNETRMDGYTYVGDEVTYTITIENLSSPEKSWLDVIARADIPEGLKFMPGSIYLTTASGEVIHVEDNAYNDLTRILALNVGDIAGGETIKVVFKAEVTVDAINKDIGMTAKGYGTLPSEFDVEDEEYVKPEPGTAFVPAEGWDLYDQTHTAIFNPDKVYPSEKVTAQTPPLPNTPEEAEQAAKLAKTSDFMGFAALGVGAIAIIAAVVLIIARKRIQKK